MRPIRPEDKDALTRAFQRLSEQSRYQRFMTAVSELSESQLRYLTEVDHSDHEALIAFDAATGEGVGVARFIRLEGDPARAEAAVTVIDEWHGQGLGTALAALLAERAREQGIERFTALLLASNDQMQDVLASLGPATESTREARGSQVGSRAHRGPVRAQRQVRDDAAEPVGEQRRHLAPARPVDEGAVHEDHRRAVGRAALRVGDRALLEGHRPSRRRPVGR